MELKLKRIARRDTYTIGHLYIDGEYFCDTIEDKDRGLAQHLPLEVNKAKKKYSETAIPTGRYQVTLSVKSPKFALKKAYEFCGGYLPRLLKVPAFDGVLIHIGNTAKDSAGCILVGQNKVVGQVINSTETFAKLYNKLRHANGQIWISIY
ncbi:MAG: hypothetical protein J5733_07675 [Bacteroidaceae bacterium]|nr:hypothetical protein [Bacteroidaceae bacterium]